MIFHGGYDLTVSLCSSTVRKSGNKIFKVNPQNFTTSWNSNDKEKSYHSVTCMISLSVPFHFCCVAELDPGTSVVRSLSDCDPRDTLTPIRGVWAQLQQTNKLLTNFHIFTTFWPDSDISLPPNQLITSFILSLSMEERAKKACSACKAIWKEWKRLTWHLVIIHLRMDSKQDCPKVLVNKCEVISIIFL